MKVSIAIALPQRQDVIDLDLPEGSTVAQAIVAAQPAARFPGLDVEGLQMGIWSRACTPQTVLREGDRVELYRPLVADPKHQRRERARKPR